MSSWSGGAVGVSTPSGSLRDKSERRQPTSGAFAQAAVLGSASKLLREIFQREAKVDKQSDDKTLGMRPSGQYLGLVSLMQDSFCLVIARGRKKKK